MDIQTYIKSGIIQDYCLGLLEQEACKAVAQYALEYEEVRMAIESCEHALKRFVEDTGFEIDHPLSQKEKIFQALKINQ